MATVIYTKCQFLNINMIIKIRHTLYWMKDDSNPCSCVWETYIFSQNVAFLPFQFKGAYFTARCDVYNPLKVENKIFDDNLYWSNPFLLFVFKLIMPTAYKTVTITINYIKSNNLSLYTQSQGFALACVVIPDPVELFLQSFTVFYPIPGHTSIQYSAHFGILVKIICIDVEGD